MLETVAALHKEGLEVKVAVILLDREQGGVRKLRDWGITAVRCVWVSVCIYA